MHHYVESNDLVHDPCALLRRLQDDGYLFLRDILPRDDVIGLRRQILEICSEAGWLRPGTDPLDGLCDREPILESDPEFAPVYARIQALEDFHRLKLHPNILSIMEALFDESVVPFPQTIGRVAFPRDNQRGTKPHQDWIFVGGSVDTISCWVPIGDISADVGGLKILEGSHKAGLLLPRPAQGPGGRVVDVDPSLRWLQSEYRSGDILLFKMLTIHGAAPNNTPDILRTSVDFRYVGESHVISEEWLKPHFNKEMRGHFAWEFLERDWSDSQVAHYWERLPKLKTMPHAFEHLTRGPTQ